MAKNFIKAATAKGKGVFAAKAKKAGETTKAYALEHKGATGKLGKESRLALTLLKLQKKK